MIFILRGSRKHVIATSDSLFSIIETLKGFTKEALKRKKKRIVILQFETGGFQKKVSAQELIKAWEKATDKPLNINNL